MRGGGGGFDFFTRDGLFPRNALFPSAADVWHIAKTISAEAILRRVRRPFLSSAGVPHTGP